MPVLRQSFRDNSARGPHSSDPAAGSLPCPTPRSAGPLLRSEHTVVDGQLGAALDKLISLVTIEEDKSPGSRCRAADAQVL